VSLNGSRIEAQKDNYADNTKPEMAAQGDGANFVLQGVFLDYSAKKSIYGVII